MRQRHVPHVRAGVTLSVHWVSALGGVLGLSNEDARMIFETFSRRGGHTAACPHCGKPPMAHPTPDGTTQAAEPEKTG